MAQTNISYKPQQDLLGKIIKGFASLSHMLFPKKTLKTIEPGEFGIVSMRVQGLIEGYLVGEEDSLFDNIQILLKGPIPRLDYNVNYYFEAELVENERYGLQYDIKQLHKMFRFDTLEQKKVFLNTIIGESKTELLCSHFEDPIQPLEAEDSEALVKIKGIGEEGAHKLLDKYKKNIGSEGALVTLQEYGLTFNMIKKLQNKFKSTDTVLYILQNDPYSLIDTMDGIGWEKADAIALNGGYNPCGEKRIRGYVQFFLEQQASNEGHSWISLDFLVNAIKSIAPRIEDEDLRGMLRGWIDGDNRLLYYDAPSRRIGLIYYRKLEEKIAVELLRLQQSPIKTFDRDTIDKAIKESEQVVGYEYTEEQKEAIYKCLDNPVSIISGAAGCVDKDTEFFNGQEWKKISEYKKGDLVLQYDIENGVADLAEPIEYIKLSCNTLNLIKTKSNSINMCLSDEHNVMCQKRDGSIYKISCVDFINKHEKLNKGFYDFIPYSFRYSGSGIGLTEAELRLMIAVCADGAFMTKHTNRCRMNLKKKHKQERIRMLLAQAGIDFEEKQWNPKDLEYKNFIFQAPQKYKNFPKEWYNCTLEQFEIICDEVKYWDFHRKNNVFCSNSLEDCTFLQFAFNIIGCKSRILVDDRVGRKHSKSNYVYKKINYALMISKIPYKKIGIAQAGKGSKKLEIKKTKTEDGFKYCFTMPKGTLILRREGSIFCTFNCGKTSIMHPICNLFSMTKQSFAQTSLSGKAASNLSEITGEEGKTIHRLLKYNPEKGFKRNKNTPLHNKAIILDEISLVGGEIFLSLLEAIPSGSRLICLGDPNQLPALGLANILSDLINSKEIAASRLVKIHRQAEKSGIISESLRISAKEQIISQTPTIETRGALNDLKIISYTDSDLSEHHVMAEYNRLHFDLGIPVKDIMVVVPNKSRGKLSSFSLNQKIQACANPYEVKSITITQEGKPLQIKENDKILIGKNNYDTLDIHEKECPVFNGNTGFVTKIEDDKIIVDLTQQGKVVIPKKNWGIIELGYAITAHRAQGSSSPYVIVGIDNGSYTLHSKEWVYTALTRAKKHCTLVAQIAAIRRATGISGVVHKQTWLQEILNNFTEDVITSCVQPLENYKYISPEICNLMKQN